MNLSESLTEFWKQQTGKQKGLLLIIAGVILLLIFSGWIDSAYSNYKVRQAEREAEKAKVAAEQLVEHASKIATEIRQREIEVKELEEKRDAKKTELDIAKRKTADAQSDYDRDLSEPIKSTPSTDELCRQLSELGYPCR